MEKMQYIGSWIMSIGLSCFIVVLPAILLISMISWYIFGISIGYVASVTVGLMVAFGSLLIGSGFMLWMLAGGFEGSNDSHGV